MFNIAALLPCRCVPPQHTLVRFGHSGCDDVRTVMSPCGRLDTTYGIQWLTVPRVSPEGNAVISTGQEARPVRAEDDCVDPIRERKRRAGLGARRNIPAA